MNKESAHQISSLWTKLQPVGALRTPKDILHRIIIAACDRHDTLRKYVAKASIVVRMRNTNIAICIGVYSSKFRVYKHRIQLAMSLHSTILI